VTLFLLTLPFFAVGLITGRLAAGALPVVVWGLFFGGVAAGWWRSGLGDGWELAIAVLIFGGSFAAVAGVLIRRGMAHFGNGRTVSR
jgi:hypothetical protein